MPQTIKPPVKTPLRESVERLAQLATEIEEKKHLTVLKNQGIYQLAKDIRKVLHAVRGG